MLAKKSAFDVLMNKFKAKEEKMQDSDSDISVIEIKIDKKDTNQIKQHQQEINNTNNKCQINKTSSIENNASYKENLNISPMFKTVHINQLKENELEFLQNPAGLSFKTQPVLNQSEIESILKQKINYRIGSDFKRVCKCESISELETYSKQLNAELSLKDVDEGKETGCKIHKETHYQKSKRRRTETRSKQNENCQFCERGKNVENKSSENCELWTEKYQFKDEEEIVTNQSQLERLKEWLTNWKSILSKETNGNNSSKSKNSKISNDSYMESDFSYDSDYSNADSIYGANRKFYPNALLLSGPHGSGKTSSIYSVAKQLGFKVFEVNSSSLRCKSQILQELDGVLNSHHVSNNNNNNSSSTATNPNQTNPSISNFFKKSTTTTTTTTGSKQETVEFKLDKFFKSNYENSKPAEAIKTQSRKKRKNSLRRETFLSLQNSNKKQRKKHVKKSIDEDAENEDEEDDGDNSEDEDYDANNNKGKRVERVSLDNEANGSENSVNIHKESLILFDEIDVVFKEDVGFWSAVNHFVKKSKKPVILTTSDEYLQHKINLNIEKIDYLRPRVDAAIKYLTTIAKREGVELDAPLAYRIVREASCDMRRALIQLQFLIIASKNCLLNPFSSLNLNTTLTIDKYLASSVDTKQICHLHNIFKKSENLFFLDYLTSKLRTNSVDLNFNLETSSGVKKYDIVLVRNGLSDFSDIFTSYSSNSSTNAQTNNSNGFNPFAQQACLNLGEFYFDEFNSSREKLNEFYEAFVHLFNQNKMIEFHDWNKFGHVSAFNYASSSSMNKFAQYNYKFTSNAAISLDYRPFLQQICRVEEGRQSALKRRYLHYLSHLNIGLVKEDYSLIAKSALALKNEAIVKPTEENELKSLNQADENIFSDEN